MPPLAKRSPRPIKATSAGAGSPALLDCFAAVAPGLEAMALAEARSLGLPVRAEEGGLAWRGDARSVLVANVGLRIASRVLVRIASFEARTFIELERWGRRIPWSRVVRPGAKIAVDSNEVLRSDHAW